MTPRHASTGWAAWLVAAVVWLAPPPASAAERPADGPQGEGRAYAFNEFLVGQPRFTLPFYLFNGHILIDAAVDGRRGKIMFDTGTEFPFFLNNHFLPLARDRLVGRGHAGSGQPMVLYRQDAPLASIEIANQLRFENVAGVTHTDWDFVAQAYTPYLLGSLGHGFNRNYLFVIDYDAQTIDFHALDRSDGVPVGVVDPARVIATLLFVPTGVDGKMPEVEMRIGDQAITAVFDTGNPGSLELTESARDALLAQGRLILATSDYTYGVREPRVHATLTGLTYGTQPLHEVRSLTFTLGPRNRVGLGYHFLRHYVSAWDYRQRTLTLLRR